MASEVGPGDNAACHSELDIRAETFAYSDMPNTTTAPASDNGPSHVENRKTSNVPVALGPRRGSFPDQLPDGHTHPQPIDPLTPTVRTAPLVSSVSGSVAPESVDDAHLTDSDPEFRSSGPSRRMSAVLRSSDGPEGGTINVFTDANVDVEPVSTSFGDERVVRRNKRYTLADGSVVSGKGLGRGRPGIKRGPRNLTHQTDEELPEQADFHPLLPQTLTTSKAPANKRRRTGPHPSGFRIATSNSMSASADSRESSLEYNPTATHTRSGRQTQKPVDIVKTLASTSSPARKTTSANPPAHNTPPANFKNHPKIKRRVYRGREQFALCEHCLRGHGPAGNVIVFCDACNKCWHQRCHEPQISRQTVSDSKAEWFCADCDRILHGGKKSKKHDSKTHISPKASAPVTSPPKMSYSGPRVGGRQLNPDQRLAYLNTLSKDNLVSLLMDAAYLAPDLPVFQLLLPAPPTRMNSEAQFTSTYVTPVSNPAQLGESARASGDDPLDEGYDGIYDEHAALYPKPGFGVQLPPEREDLHMLLEGNDSRTFSYWVRGMHGNEFSGTGNIVPR